MKNKINLILITITVIIFNGCEKLLKYDFPEIKITNISNITLYSADLTGEIEYDDNGEIKEMGICWLEPGYGTLMMEGRPLIPHTIDNHKKIPITLGSVDIPFQDLKPNSEYYIRIYVIIDDITYYSDVISFSTLTLTAHDIDGHEYQTVIIGSQIWMLEDLRTTKYNDGTPILDVDFNDTICNGFGALYKWDVINSNKLCPDGWHIPNKDEIQVLIDYLGGENIAGKKLKATANYWYAQHEYDADNSSGFTALPCNIIEYYNYGYASDEGYWCTPSAYGFKLVSFNSEIVLKSNYSKDNLFKVRCLKD